MPFEQCRAQLVLERHDVPAQRTLRNEQPCGGVAKRTLAGHFPEVTQARRLDHVCAPSMPAHSNHPSIGPGIRVLAGGVCIVATAHEETRLGLTATSVCSLTLDPPMIVVCVNRDAGAHATMLETRRISVNFPGADRRPARYRLALRVGRRVGIKPVRS
ncbi:MAG: flavin reductase family protein [Lautropia sp.]